jgi:hypothetical protein
LFDEIEDLNLNWFFRNKGEMFISNSKEDKLQGELNQALRVIEQKDETIKFYEDIIKESLRKSKEDTNFQKGDTNRLLVDDVFFNANTLPCYL